MKQIERERGREREGGREREREREREGERERKRETERERENEREGNKLHYLYKSIRYIKIDQQNILKIYRAYKIIKKEKKINNYN